MTEEKRPAHRPLKGGTPRDQPVRLLAEKWAKDTFTGDAREGESQADVFHRWAGDVRSKKGGA